MSEEYSSTDDEGIKFPEYSKEDLDKAYEEASDAVNHVHKDLSEAAENTGYVARVISLAKPQLDNLFHKAQSDPSIYPIVASGIEYLNSLANEFKDLKKSTSEVKVILNFATNSTSTFSSSTGSASILWNPEYTLEPFLLPPNRETREYYAAKLENCDPSLAKSYNQIWESHLSASSDPQRAALYMMRTFYDNFFAWIAPDDEVRASPYWHKKIDEKPNQIWKSERLSYVLNVHVKDENRRKVLEAETKQILVLYKALNEAHDRGSLDENKASASLIAMDNLLRDWIDTLL
jgi:hypothetical protein